MEGKINNLDGSIYLWIVMLICFMSVISYINTLKECEQEVVVLNIILDEGIWDIPKVEYQKLIDEQITGKTTLIYQQELETKWLKD